MSMEITPADLNQPSRVVGKFAKALISGAGGVMAGSIDTLLKKLPIFSNGGLTTAAEVIETIGYMAAAGMVDNENIEALLTGATAGISSKIAEKIINLVSSKISGIAPAKITVSQPITLGNSNRGRYAF